MAAAHLVQIILPLRANGGKALPRSHFDEVKRELARVFGGVTAFTRSPAEGLWDNDQAVQAEDVVLYEVMTDRLDRAWWANYRSALEARFLQEMILIRAHEMEQL